MIDLSTLRATIAELKQEYVAATSDPELTGDARFDAEDRATFGGQALDELLTTWESGARVSPRRENPVPNSYGELECQHGNPVPGYCASCDELYAPEDAMPLPPDPDGRNGERAAWAQAALDAYMVATRSDPDTALSDLLGDLLHWCDRHRMDFDAALVSGRYHYGAEIDPNGWR